MHAISRGGVLASKWGIAIIYMAIGLVLVFVGGLIGGGLAFGLHAPLLLSGQTVSVGHGLWLTLLSFLYVLRRPSAACSRSPCCLPPSRTRA